MPSQVAAENSVEGAGWRGVMDGSFQVVEARRGCVERRAAGRRAGPAIVVGRVAIAEPVGEDLIDVESRRHVGVLKSGSYTVSWKGWASTRVARPGPPWWTSSLASPKSSPYQSVPRADRDAERVR